MPTTIQNPQLMCPPFLRPLRANAVSVFVLDVDHDGSRKLVVPTLLALVECDPEKSEKRRDDRNEISQEAPDQPPGRWLTQPVGGDDPRLHQHFPGRGAAETPKEYGRYEKTELHPDIAYRREGRIGAAENFELAHKVSVEIARGHQARNQLGVQLRAIITPIDREHHRRKNEADNQGVDEEGEQAHPEAHVSGLARCHHVVGHGHPLRVHGSPTFVTEATSLYDGPQIRKGRA